MQCFTGFTLIPRSHSFCAEGSSFYRVHFTEYPAETVERSNSASDSGVSKKNDIVLDVLALF